MGIIDPHHDSIFIAGDIENHAAILEDACGPNDLLHLRWARPVGCLDLPIPRGDRVSRVGIGGASLMQARLPIFESKTGYGGGMTNIKGL